MNFFRNVILPIAGIGYEWHLHKLSSELSKQQHAEATIQHNESEQNAQMLSSAELITSTLSTKLETYRDACEEKLKKYSNYLLMTSIIIGVLGQILPFILPEHNKYILNSSLSFFLRKKALYQPIFQLIHIRMSLNNLFLQIKSLLYFDLSINQPLFVNLHFILFLSI